MKTKRQFILCSFVRSFRPELLKNDLKVFFVKYNDPVYVKIEKLDIMIRLTDASNIGPVLAELKEFEQIEKGKNNFSTKIFLCLDIQPKSMLISFENLFEPLAVVRSKLNKQQNVASQL